MSVNVSSVWHGFGDTIGVTPNLVLTLDKDLFIKLFFICHRSKYTSITLVLKSS